MHKKSDQQYRIQNSLPQVPSQLEKITNVEPLNYEENHKEETKLEYTNLLTKGPKTPVVEKDDKSYVLKLELKNSHPDFAFTITSNSDLHSRTLTPQTK